MYMMAIEQKSKRTEFNKIKGHYMKLIKKTFNCTKARYAHFASIPTVRER